MREHHLESDLLVAFGSFLGDNILGNEWSQIASTIAEAIAGGQFTLDQAARVNYLLARTQDQQSSECATCGCPDITAGHRW